MLNIICIDISMTKTSRILQDISGYGHNEWIIVTSKYTFNVALFK